MNAAVVKIPAIVVIYQADDAVRSATFKDGRPRLLLLLLFLFLLLTIYLALPLRMGGT